MIKEFLNEFRFGDWLWYHTITVLAVFAVLLFYVITGAYIQWVVGPIPAPSVAAQPYTSVAQGWASSGSCLDAPAPNQGMKVCAFTKQK